MALTNEMVSAGLQSTRALAINGSVATALTAAGSNQATALALGAATNVFGTVAASTGARLPVGNLGDEVFVRNAGANALAVYPPVGGTVNGGATNAADGTALAAAASYRYKCVSANGLAWVR